MAVTVPLISLAHLEISRTIPYRLRADLEMLLINSCCARLKAPWNALVQFTTQSEEVGISFAQLPPAKCFGGGIYRVIHPDHAPRKGFCDGFAKPGEKIGFEVTYA